MTQYDVVLERLKEFKKITTWEAYEDYGITRLSAIIYNIRAEGYDIESIPKTRKNRLGNSVTYSEYKLHMKENK